MLVMVLSVIMLGACGKDKKIETQTSAKVTATPTPTSTTDPTKAPDAGEVAVKAIQDKVASGPMKMRDISSVDLVKEIKIGWSLGNTMDASGNQGVLDEIAWGNPKTSKKMIDAVKEAGFNTIRIPVSWQDHIGKAPEYTIDKVWMDRVQQLVNWAYADDMYVIINMHHEDWYSPYKKTEDKAIDELEKTWKQIADRFQNYDEHLIFEGLNEPRHKGDPDEWTGGNKEGWEVVNDLNAAFVKTIRSCGGNNPQRHLMCPPYAASSSLNTWQDFKVPKDDKIIVSIHAYTPYNFALNAAGTSEWSVSNKTDTYEIDYLMDNIKTNFIDKGIPVILGEFGAVDKKNTEARTAWAEYYVKKAHEVGVPCIVWDNNAFFSGETLGLLNRFKCEWQYPQIVKALMKGLE
jgi:endoglucanase